MSNVIEHINITAYHPGYYVADIIEDMGISQAEFAMRLGTTGKTLSNLVNGQINISNDLAKKLSVMLGTSPDVWLNLQTAYDSKLIEIEKAEDFEKQKSIARLLDYKYFVENANLPDVKDYRRKVANLCGYFKISNLEIFKEPDFLINSKSGTAIVESNAICSRAWLLTAINCAEEISTEPFDAEKLKVNLPALGKMSRFSANEYLPEITSALAKCGVAFVVLPGLKNSGINGAVKWINHNRVVFAMDKCVMDSDRFWPSFFCGIKYVFQQKVKKVFISSDTKDIINLDYAMDADSGAFAAKYIMPKAE